MCYKSSYFSAYLVWTMGLSYFFEFKPEQRTRYTNKY